MEQIINNISIVKNEDGTYNCVAPDGRVLLEHESLEYAELVSRTTVDYLPKIILKELDSDALKSVQDTLKSVGLNGLDADMITLDGESVLCIDVVWGDWKHTHLFMNHVLSMRHNFRVMQEVVTEEDGSDCYSAQHFYTLINT